MALSNFEILQASIAGTLPDNVREGFTFPPPAATTIGFRLTNITKEPSATIEMASDLTLHANPMGTLHGGILCDVADAAIGCAHWGTLLEGQSFTTIDLKINFFRPMWNGKIRAVSSRINRGKTISYYSCDVTRVEDGKLLAVVTSTVMTLYGNNAKGR